jgi:GR25 family glycosyltransferase involved in LPS biosynthesis
MYNTINDLYKNINDLDKSNSLLKNFYMLPGFNIIEPNNSSTDCDLLNNTTNIIKENQVIDNKLYMNFLDFFNNTNNNKTQKTKPKSDSVIKLSKKQDKTFTRKQTKTQSQKQKQKQKQK